MYTTCKQTTLINLSRTFFLSSFVVASFRMVASAISGFSRRMPIFCKNESNDRTKSSLYVSSGNLSIYSMKYN